MSLVRTAIFGGSFNPVHNGHVLLARQVLAEQLADEVWLMVSPQNPLKSSHTLLDEKARYRLVEKALQNERFIKASNFEFHLPRPSYTWDTLRALTESYADRTFSLLIGADNWQLFPKWAHPDKIINNHTIIIYPRKGYHTDTASLPATVHVLSGSPLFPYSSTDVRHAITHGEDVSEMLPPAIKDEACKLYARPSGQ